MADNDPTPTPAPDPTPDPTPAPDPAPDPGRTFSQADLDKIVQDRLARERQKYDGFDDLKKKAEEFDKLQEAQKTELQKAQDRAAQLERDAAAATELVQRTLVNSAIVAEAAKRGIDTDIAVAMIDRAALEFGQDGNPTNVASAMDSLLKAKPHLANGGARGGSADQGARGGGADQLSREALKNMSPEEINNALAEGKLTHVLSGGS